MRRIFLTSGLVLCLSCPAFADIAAGVNSANCTESVLESTTGPVDFVSDWRPMISAAITLNSNKYSGTNGSPTLQHSVSTTATPTPLYAVYGVGVYSSPQPTVGTLSNFTTNNRLTSLTQTPQLAGYRFDGFYTTPVSDGTQVINSYGNFVYTNDVASTQFSDESTPSTWYARWVPRTNSVFYYSGDCSTNSNPLVYGDTATYDSNYTVSSMTNNAMTSILKTGYLLDGWSTSSASNRTVNFPGASETPWTRTDDLSVYAVCSPKNYTITYNAGAHGTGNAATYTGSSNGGLTYDATWTTKTFAQTGLSANTGYTFSKWNTAQDGSGTNYNAGAAQSAWTTDAGLTLYAIYTANSHTISYSCGSASGVSGSGPNSSIVVYGSQYELAVGYGSCSKPGYHATGWDCTGGATLNNATGTQSALANNADIACSVHWVENSINLNYYGDTVANGGTSTFTTGSCTYDQTFNLPTTNLPTKNGYHRNGWNIRGNVYTCSLSGLNTAEHAEGDWHAAKNADGSCVYASDSGDYTESCSDSHVSGLTAGEWNAFNSFGTINGVAVCSARSGNSGTNWNNASSNWTATEAQLTSAGNGNYCWCKANHHIPSGQYSQCEITSTSWVFLDQEQNCAQNCAARCADRVESYPEFQTAFFSVQ